jgi:uncharacterized protein (UPF0332 family)
MSNAKNKVDWCLRKAEKELKESDKHRGLVKIKPNKDKAYEHIKKAEHYLKATLYLKDGHFSDISASTVFYSMYQCLLAITIKFGYESRNQTCTFALIHSLIEDGKIDFKKDLIDSISTLDVDKNTEDTSIEIRERYQYGTSMSLDDNIYNRNLKLAKEVISKTKLIIETE